MKQHISIEELNTRVDSLAQAMGDLTGQAHAGVLSKAFSAEALERALNLAFARQISGMLPDLLTLHKHLAEQPSGKDCVLPGDGALGRSFADNDFKTFGIQTPDFTYMVVLEPLPPMVHQAFPDMKDWAIHLRVCTSSAGNPAMVTKPLDTLGFLSEFVFHADRPTPKGQKYFGDWDCSDRGFLASTEPTTGGEGWTPAGVTRGLGVTAFQQVLDHLESLAQALRTRASTKGHNTLLRLSYRDAGNYGSCLEEVLPGPITEREIALMRELLNDGYQVIAEQVGLPTPGFIPREGEGDWPSEEMDHVWTVIDQFEEKGDDLSPADFLTDQAPTLVITVGDLLEKLKRVVNSKKGWDILAEWSRMESAASWGSRHSDGQGVLRPLPLAA